MADFSEIVFKICKSAAESTLPSLPMLPTIGYFRRKYL